MKNLHFCVIHIFGNISCASVCMICSFCDEESISLKHIGINCNNASDCLDVSQKLSLMLLFCLIVLEACPLGSYCPLATLNKTTGVCEPWVLILAQWSVSFSLSCCLHGVVKLMDKYISADIFISCLQCRQTIPVVEQMFGPTLVAVVRYFAQLDHIVQQPQKEFPAVVGIILLPRL